jgi:peroxiredoxin Q/BCP
MALLRLAPGLKPGDPAPDFDRLDEDGARHTLGGYRGRWLVLFFYPKDNSSGCMKEACRFNDDFDLFQDLGADILGCSGQDAESHRRFRRGCRLRYRLLSDPGRAMRDAWQVPHFLRVLDGRCTFLIDPQGILRWVHNQASRPEEHSSRALAFLRQSAASKEQE